MIARRSSRHRSRSAESEVIDALGVDKASRRIFVPTEPVVASDERHKPVRAPERLVGDTRSWSAQAAAVA